MGDLINHPGGSDSVSNSPPLATEDTASSESETKNGRASGAPELFYAGAPALAWLRSHLIQRRRCEKALLKAVRPTAVEANLDGRFTGAENCGW